MLQPSCSNFKRTGGVRDTADYKNLTISHHCVLHSHAATGAAADVLKELLQRPGFWYSVRVVPLVMKDLRVVLAYLDEVVVFDARSAAHLQTIGTFFGFSRQRQARCSPHGYSRSLHFPCRLC